MTEVEPNQTSKTLSWACAGLVFFGPFLSVVFLLSVAESGKATIPDLELGLCWACGFWTLFKSARVTFRD